MLNHYTAPREGQGDLIWQIIMSKITESPLFGIAVTQVIATFLASALCLIFDRTASISALMAGVVSVVPSVYLLFVSRRPTAEGDTGIGIVLRGEVGKFALSISLFALVFVFVKPLNAIAFFATYILLQLCTVIAPWLEAKRLLR
ncbi:MAG: ATP synthase protein I [Candidatus Azotimanducaceae bacterium]|jgi:ATP synthase protein I